MSKQVVPAPHLQRPAPRLGNLDAVREIYIRWFGKPPTSDAAFRLWLNRRRIPRLKANPFAKYGGGPCAYDLAAFEDSLAKSIRPPRSSSK